MSKTTLIISSSVLAFALAGCETTAGHLSPTYGAAQNAAIDKQVVSTAAVPGAPVLDPVMVDAAIERYHTNAVKQPKQAGGSGGGGSN